MFERERKKRKNRNCLRKRSEQDSDRTWAHSLHLASQLSKDSCCMPWYQRSVCVSCNANGLRIIEYREAVLSTDTNTGWNNDFCAVDWYDEASSCPGLASLPQRRSIFSKVSCGGSGEDGRPIRGSNRLHPSTSQSASFSTKNVIQVKNGQIQSNSKFELSETHPFTESYWN